MPYPLLEAYLANINNLRAEENLFLLRIANDPKPTYQIDPEKSRGVGQLEESLVGMIEEEKPYYLETELDREGLHRLKDIMSEAQATRRQNA